MSPFARRKSDRTFSSSSDELRKASLSAIERAALEGSGIDAELEKIPVEQANLLPESRVVFHTDPRGPAADRFRYLRMSLREPWETGKLKTLLITSALPKDGKSTVALNLATALVENGKRSVLLIEGDLHHPTLRQQLGLQPGPGLSEAIEEKADPISAIRKVDPLGIYLLPAGEPRGNPSELLQSEDVVSVMAKLTPLFDWIVIDSPPLAPLADALALARIADGTLMVARAGQTSVHDVEETIERIGKRRVLGVILNAVEGLDRIYAKYQGYYGDSSSPKTTSDN